VPEERRLVTVVFADVVGSTALGEQLDAEDLRAMLGAYYAIAKDVIASYGGTLEKFIGDAVMGIFGLPHSHGDDPERAVRASLELRDRVRADPELADLKLRFGVCSGEVVATREPGADFLVTGDAVNVAARLQQAAEPWSVLASERTLTALSPAFDLGPSLDIEAKGKGSAITAREIRSMRAGGAAIARPKAPMHGRQDELDQLALVARRAFRDKRPAFVTIIAPAGTGKTRLLEEFLVRELPLIAPSTAVAVAQCLPYGSQLTYWPLRQVLFGLTGAPEDASPVEIRERVGVWLDNPRYADLLATSIGYGLGEAPDRADVFAAWRYALEKASASQPLALVFEDLHWSSESLLDLVDFVMQGRGDSPILMLALSRPELLDRRPGWGGGRRNFSNLFLEPLAADDMRQLVRDLLEGGTDMTIDAVVTRAGGNPFYAEELVRSVIERGNVEALPDTVQASIQARLDLLPAEERRVLQLGSIFGRTFRISGVVAIGPELASNIDSLIEGLLQRDVVKRDDLDHLTFVHILIREVTYQALTRAERARLHAAVGKWLESRAQGREAAVAELVALHFREAASLIGRQRLANLDEADVKSRAVRWLWRAGDAAGAAGANLEAGRHFRAAIELASEEQLPELYERLGDVEQLLFSSIEAYSRALELGRRLNRPAVDELRLLGGLLMCCMRWAEGVGRFPIQDIDRMLDEGRALAATIKDPRTLARFFAVEAFYPWHITREGGQVTPEMISASEDSGRRSAALAESVQDWNTWSAAVDGITSCLIARREWQSARGMAQRRIARQNELSIVERMDAYHMVGLMSLLSGDLAAAEETLRDAMVLLDYVQQPSAVLALLGNLMYVLMLQGRWDEIFRLGEQAVRVWNESKVAIGPGRIGFIVGTELSRARQDLARAPAFIDALIQMTKSWPTAALFRAFAEGDRPGLVRELPALINRGTGRADLLERALSTLNDHGQRLDEPTLHALRQRTHDWRIPLIEAQLSRAQGEFEAAATIFAQIGAKPYEARARIELAQAQGTQPDSNAVDVLRKLGDIEYLESHDLGA
jgi:class 3 adenylate cyclase/tetratricopeptide (TPR) repeat protein